MGMRKEIMEKGTKIETVRDRVMVGRIKKVN